MSCVLDFPEKLALISLTDLPNSLYNGKNRTETDGSREKRPSAAAVNSDLHVNRRNRSSSSGPLFDKPVPTGSIQNGSAMTDDIPTEGQRHPNTTDDTQDARTSTIAPVRLWSALISPNDKFVKPVREKTPSSVSAPGKSARENTKPTSVAPSQDNQNPASRSSGSKSKKLTPSRDQPDDKKSHSSQNSKPAAGNETGAPQSSTRKAPQVQANDRKSPSRLRENSSGRKSLHENHAGASRESRATSQGRSGKIEGNNTSAAEKKNQPVKQASGVQSETSKRKQRKKKTAAASTALEQTEVQMPPAPAPHIDDLADFPTLPTCSVRTDNAWDSAYRQHSGSLAAAPLTGGITVRWCLVTF